MNFKHKILLIVLIALFTGCGDSKPKPKPWQEFVSTEHKFKALFPGEPVTGPKQTNKMPGGSIDSYTISRVEGKFKYEIVYSELPSLYKNFPVDKLLNSLIDNTLKTLNAANVKKTDVNVNSFRGREVEFDLPDNMAGKGRIAVDGNRVFIIIMKVPKENIASADIAKFLDSLEIK